MFIVCDREEKVFALRKGNVWVTTHDRAQATLVPNEVMAAAIVGYHYGGHTPEMVVKEDRKAT